MVAAEASHLKPCYDNLRHKVRPKAETGAYSVYADAFETLFNEIEGPLQAGKLMYMTVLRIIHKSSDTCGCASDRCREISQLNPKKKTA